MRSDVALNDVTVRVSAMVHENGQYSLPAESVRWNFVGAIPLNKNTPNTPTERLVRAAPCEAPDVLRAERSLNLTAGRTQPIWLTFFVPEDAPAGKYRGQVTVVAGDARIYTTDGAGGGLPTTAVVEKEIKDREAACVKPGNLLHWTRGVRARASEGYYAPWFHQYYYYALNGISDDDGWHVTHAPLPQWLELTLPRAAKIGRVVIHTPNLRDYDVQFQSPDGSTQIAEIRGNTVSVAEHHFNPPILTLKLRITARAVRDAESKAMVR